MWCPSHKHSSLPPRLFARPDRSSGGLAETDLEVYVEYIIHTMCTHPCFTSSCRITIFLCHVVTREKHDPSMKPTLFAASPPKIQGVFRGRPALFCCINPPGLMIRCGYTNIQQTSNRGLCVLDV